MRKNLSLLVLLAVFMAALVGTGFYFGKRIPSGSRAPETPISQPPAVVPLPLMRAVHYFGKVSPTNFWNAVTLAEVPQDLAQIKKDGFDTIVLVVPWPEFQPKIRTDAPLNEAALQRLTEIIRLAAQTNLKVALRLGYAWSPDPEMDVGVMDRIDSLFYDDAIYQRWLNHLDAICRQVCQEPNLLFGFLSWEDLYPINITGPGPNLSHPEINQRFRSYLQSRFRLEEINQKMETQFSDWSQVVMPPRRHPSYRLVMEYWDHTLLNRLFAGAQKKFPKLSMEVRLDADPIWEKGGNIEWHSHAATYKLPNAPLVAIHYAISWGMKNEGDRVSAADALKMFDRALLSVRDQIGTTPLWVDQFLFFDNTPMFSKNTQVHDNELDDFIVGAADILQKRQASLGLWQYRDYAMSVVYNPSFEVGLSGWTVKTASAKPAVRANNGVHLLDLPTGASIRQRIDGMNLRQRYPGANESVPAEVCFLAEALSSSAAVEIVIDEQPPLVVPVKGPQQRYCQAVQVPLKFDLTLQNTSGATVSIDQIELFNHVQDSRLYDRENKPKSSLAAIRRLNQRLLGALNGGLGN